MSRPTVHLLCGLPASGKTTYAAALADRVAGLHLSLDEWMLRTTSLPYDDPGYVALLPAVKGLMLEVGAQVLALGHDVVLDWNHWSPERRAESAAWARENDADVVVHHVDVPVDEAVRRASSRAAGSSTSSHLLDEAAVRHAESFFVPPAEAEGLTVVRAFATPSD